MKKRFTLATCSLVTGILLFTASCQTDQLSKNEVKPVAAQETILNSQDQLAVDKIKHASLVITELMKDADLISEVNWGISTGYYKDERIRIKDW